MSERTDRLGSTASRPSPKTKGTGAAARLLRPPRQRHRASHHTNFASVRFSSTSFAHRPSRHLLSPLCQPFAGPLCSRSHRKLTILTHCNTGSLATAGYGTALGVVRALSEAGKLEAVYASETRPYNQGARLTAYELVQDKLLPAYLITDSAAASLMAAGA